MGKVSLVRAMLVQNLGFSYTETRDGLDTQPSVSNRAFLLFAHLDSFVVS